jgi:GT2 family glycosyltransferase
MKKIAVLITCYNRAVKTAECLEALYKNKFSENLSVFLVDDGSTDGTSDLILRLFPEVHVISGNGKLFWSGGMRLAWSEAAKGQFSYFCWLNDDVNITPDCFSELIECSELYEDNAVVVGIIEDRVTREIIYGGTGEDKRLLFPNGECQIIKNMNGNVVLVPRNIFEAVGNIDEMFRHDLGDVDYGYRAKSQGYSVVTTRCVVGGGNKNDICRVRAPGVGVVARFKKLYSPLGSPPLIGAKFRLKHFGLLNAVVYFLFVHALNLFSDNFISAAFGNKYGSAGSVVEK